MIIWIRTLAVAIFLSGALETILSPAPCGTPLFTVEKATTMQTAFKKRHIFMVAPGTTVAELCRLDLPGVRFV